MVINVCCGSVTCLGWMKIIRDAKLTLGMVTFYKTKQEHKIRMYCIQKANLTDFS